MYNNKSDEQLILIILSNIAKISNIQLLESINNLLFNNCIEILYSKFKIVVENLDDLLERPSSIVMVEFPNYDMFDNMFDDQSIESWNDIFQILNKIKDLDYDEFAVTFFAFFEDMVTSAMYHNKQLKNILSNIKKPVTPFNIKENQTLLESTVEIFMPYFQYDDEGPSKYDERAKIKRIMNLNSGAGVGKRFGKEFGSVDSPTPMMIANEKLNESLTLISSKQKEIEGIAKNLDEIYKNLYECFNGRFPVYYKDFAPLYY